MTDVSPEPQASERGSPGLAPAQLFDMAAPQPRYKTMLQTAPVICPRDGFVMAVSRAAVDQVLCRRGAAPLGVAGAGRTPAGDGRH